MIVVGIDPAPGKGLMICGDPKSDKVFTHVNISEAHFYIVNLANKEVNQEGVLICWDSPLTGPPNGYLNPTNHLSLSKLDPNPYVQRRIEKTLTTLVKARAIDSTSKPSKVSGISTLPYSQCSHWTISRAVLGLPRVGPYDRTDNLPFRLITENMVPTKPENCVIEVHPALALWLWLKDKRDDNAGTANDGDGRPSWRYKSGKKADRQAVFKDLWVSFRDLDCVRSVLDDSGKFPEEPEDDGTHDGTHDDDHLDAMVAYTLGKLWLRGDGSVKLYGDESCGSMLLPVELEALLPESGICG